MFTRVYRNRCVVFEEGKHWDFLTEPCVVIQLPNKDEMEEFKKRHSGCSR